ncbi:MAG: hypothetical protein D6693_06510 [Planctomycetota bacterium]|nr:MAG: hypothetical protein D6693_06510 [Planctomycetota bacterium]
MRRAGLIGALALAGVLLAGCGSSGPVRTAGAPFDAMTVRVEPAGDRWEAVFTAPTGGWRARFDTTRRMFEGWEVFVTLVRPHPSLMVTQAQTDLHVLTPISTDESVRVYARIVADANPDEKPPGLFRSLFGWLLPAPSDGPAYQPALNRAP